MSQWFVFYSHGVPPSDPLRPQPSSPRSVSLVLPQSYLYKKKPFSSISLPQMGSQCTLSVSLLCLPRLHPELHLERMRGRTPWRCESHLNRCSSWADTQASPRESMLLLQQERAEAENGVTNCVFLISIALIYSFPLPHCYPSTPHYPAPTHVRHSPILFPVSLYPLERKACSCGNEEG